MKELLRKKSITIALLLIVAAIIAVIVGMNVQSAQKENEYNAHIEAAEKYLTELDYEQAIAEYTLALEIEPNAEEVLNGLEKTYLAYADASADAGEYEKAIQILNEGYAQTGRESLQEKLTQIQEMQAQAEEYLNVEEEKKEQMIELPLDNITICGYGLDEAYSEQILSMYPTEDYGNGQGHGTDASKGIYSIYEDQFDDSTVKKLTVYEEPGGKDSWVYEWYSDANGCYQTTIWLGNDGQSKKFSEINVPIGLGDTYEDWCRVMKIDSIKEKGRKLSGEDDGKAIECAGVVSHYFYTYDENRESWVFLTNDYICTYSENAAAGSYLQCEIHFDRQIGMQEGNEFGWEPILVRASIGQDGRIDHIEFTARQY